MLSTAAAYGLDMRSTPEEPPPVAASQPAAPANLAALPDMAQIRARIAALGVDPDSAQAQVFIRWLPKMLNDPTWQALTANRSLRQGALWRIPMSPDDRLRLLHVFKGAATDTKKCILDPVSSDFATMLKTASPRDLESLFEMNDIAARNLGSPPPPEHYALADLLDADARLNALAAAAAEPAGDAQTMCGKAAALFNAIDALPAPLQQRVSLEFFRSMGQKKTATQTLLDDPSAYFDDVFDERRLPDTLRRGLPKDGSRPLPFSRLTFDAEWVNKTTPADSAAFTDTFINRRNNGVIAEITRSDDWLDLTLSYGVASLQNQTIATGSTSETLQTVENDSPIVIASRPLVSGQSYDIEIPQPSSHGAKSWHCEVGDAKPASKVFHSLTGTAIDAQCRSVDAKGHKKSVHWSWLADYGILWTDTIDDEDGRTEIVIHNVTIEGAPQ